MDASWLVVLFVYAFWSWVGTQLYIEKWLRHRGWLGLDEYRSRVGFFHARLFCRRGSTVFAHFFMRRSISILKSSLGRLAKGTRDGPVVLLCFTRRTLHGGCFDSHAPPAMAKSKVNNKKKPQYARGTRTRGNVASRARATRVLAQGAGAVTRRPFGNGFASIPRSLPAMCWNAHSSAHAGLPRAVGPYTVVRTTTIITSKSPLLIFGTFATNDFDYHSPTTLELGEGFGKKNWTNICAVAAPAEMGVSSFNDEGIASGNNCEVHAIPVPGTTANGVVVTGAQGGPEPATFTAEYTNTTCVPSALSVQIINPTSVQDASGTSIAAVCPVRLDLMGSRKTWKTVGDEILSYYRPRVLTGGKLALRGVQMDSMPLSMTDVSDFREIYKVDPLVCAPSSLTWSMERLTQNIANAENLSPTQKTFSAAFHPEGWAPMVYYSPSAAALDPGSRQEMSFLVTMEWRVRFDISNPACSSHQMHKPSTDTQWHNMIQAATNALPGVLDIVEKIADSGSGMASAVGLARAVGRML